jgi:hypothetical protein
VKKASGAYAGWKRHDIKVLPCCDFPAIRLLRSLQNTAGSGDIQHSDDLRRAKANEQGDKFDEGAIHGGLSIFLGVSAIISRMILIFNII